MKEHEQVQGGLETILEVMCAERNSRKVKLKPNAQSVVATTRNRNIAL